MRKNTIEKASIALISVLVLTCFLFERAIVPTAASYESPPGALEARSDIDITYYGSTAAAYVALTAGSADVAALSGWSAGLPLHDGYELDAAIIGAAMADPNIQLARYDGNDVVAFDFNSNYEIPTYPGIKSPMNELDFRQAIVQLVNKPWLVGAIKGPYGTMIDQPIPATQRNPWDPGVPQLPYSPAMSAFLIEVSLGFTDLDADTWLEYPASWPGLGGTTAEQRETYNLPLVICIRSDDPEMLAAGNYLISQLQATLAAQPPLFAGFMTTGVLWQQSRTTLSPKVMMNHDYHIYTGGWDTKRYPIDLYKRYNSGFWYPDGPNYVTGLNQFGMPNYPAIDTAVEGIWRALNMPAAVAACNTFCTLYTGNCIGVPLWSTASYAAYRKGLIGVTNMNGYGLANDYTFLKALRVGGGPIRVAVPSGPDRLNALYSQWMYEYILLDRIYPSAMSVQPYNLAVEQPWVVQDWNVGTWLDGSTTKTKVTYYLRKDVGIVAPVTGKFIRFFDAHDFAFSIWYQYAFRDSWHWDSVGDIRYTNIVDINGDGWQELEVCFDYESYWYAGIVGLQLPLLPKLELEPLLCTSWTVSFPMADTWRVWLSRDLVQVVAADLNTVPLVEGVDYRIEADPTMPQHCVFTPLVTMTGTVTITFTYPAMPASGFYLGAMPWTSTMYSLGTHYVAGMTSGTPSIGDTIFLRKNAAFFLDLPLMGEIDWVWTWVGVPMPRSGRYTITIFDIVHVTGAYCMRGDGIPLPQWFPGADLDANDLCHVGILDLVTVTGRFASFFGTPPDSAHGYNIPWTPWSQALPGYNSAFTELSKSPGLAYTFTAGTVTITAAGPTDYLRVSYRTAANALEKAIFIDP